MGAPNRLLFYLNLWSGMSKTAVEIVHLQPGLSSMDENWSHHWTSWQRLTFAEDIIGSTKLQLRSGNLATLICISWTLCFISSSWWCVDIQNRQEITLVNRDLPITVKCKAWPSFLVERNSLTITYVDSKGVRQMVGEYNTDKWLRLVLAMVSSNMAVVVAGTEPEAFVHVINRQETWQSDWPHLAMWTRFKPPDFCPCWCRTAVPFYCSYNSGCD